MIRALRLRSDEPAPAPSRTGPLTADLRVRRGEFTLDLPLTVEPGEVVVLAGPNGAGKSTALRALAGLVPLTGGAVRLGGTVLAGDGVHLPPERRGCGFVFQDHLLVGHLSALENVAFGPRARGVPAKRARTDAAVWLDRLGLATHTGARATTLSGGQAQRVAISRALAVDPDFLLLDEPFAALDARSRQDVRAILREYLAAAPRPVLLVTHDPSDAAALADRALVLEDGRVVSRRSRADLEAAVPPVSIVDAPAADPVSSVVVPRPVRRVDPDGASGPVRPAVAGSTPEPPPRPPRVGVVVLAGGTARRIGGGDKTALDVGGVPILHRLLTDLTPLQTIVVADAPAEADRAPFPHARWIREQPVGGGPAAALAAGMAALDDVEVVVAVAGDQPFAGPVVPRLVDSLMRHPDADAVLGVDADGREQPLLAAYRAAAVRRRLAAVRPGHALRTVRVGLSVHLLPLAEAESLDVDAPEDLDRARELASDTI